MVTSVLGSRKTPAGGGQGLDRDRDRDWGLGSCRALGWRKARTRYRTRLDILPRVGPLGYITL